MVTIRSEIWDDYDKIYEINKQAFDGEVEARLVNNLRKTEGFVPQLSLIAIKNNEIVGHILFSIIHIQKGDNKVPILALAPMAVLPKYQNQGIGSSLVKEGLRKCKETKFQAVVLVGHPEYYPRFGFTPANKKGLKLPFEAPNNAFMVYELVPGALRGVSGTIVYPAEFTDE